MVGIGDKIFINGLQSIQRGYRKKKIKTQIVHPRKALRVIEEPQ